MLFHFRLASIEDIVPWGPKEAPTLSWFGLTDGWFWIEVGDQELFRYSDKAFEYWRRKYPHLRVPLLPYDNYQVARYWEDLLEMLPAILDPIPDDMAVLVAEAREWQQWQDALLRWPNDGQEDWAKRDRYDMANVLWKERTWDAWHLAHPPQIWLWRVDNEIHIRWDNRTVMIEGVPVLEATSGEVVLSVTEFVAEIESFHDRFLTEMEKRVDDAVADWPRPEVKIDPPHLLKEQTERQEWLKYALAPRPIERLQAFSWDDVRTAMKTLASELTPQ